MVQRLGRVGQLHKVLKVFDGGVAAALVQVAHKRRAVSRGEHGVLATNDHVVRRVAGMLGEFTRGGGLNQLAAQTAWETNALTFDVGTRCAQDVQRLGIVAEVDTDFFQNGVSVALDDLQTLFVQHFKVGNFAGDVRHGLAAARSAGGALGLASTTSTATGARCLFCWVFYLGECLIHNLTPDRAGGYESTPYRLQYGEATGSRVVSKRPALVTQRHPPDTVLQARRRLLVSP